MFLSTYSSCFLAAQSRQIHLIHQTKTASVFPDLYLDHTEVTTRHLLGKPVQRKEESKYHQNVPFIRSCPQGSQWQPRQGAQRTTRPRHRGRRTLQHPRLLPELPVASALPLVLSPAQGGATRREADAPGRALRAEDGSSRWLLWKPKSAPSAGGRCPSSTSAASATNVPGPDVHADAV